MDDYVSTYVSDIIRYNQSMRSTSDSIKYFIINLLWCRSSSHHHFCTMAKSVCQCTNEPPYMSGNATFETQNTLNAVFQMLVLKICSVPTHLHSQDPIIYIIGDDKTQRGHLTKLVRCWL